MKVNFFLNEFSSRGFDILGDVVSRPELRRWEIDDAHHRFELDLDINDEQPETSKWI
jgi:hypothetical protein